MYLARGVELDNYPYLLSKEPGSISGAVYTMVNKSVHDPALLQLTIQEGEIVNKRESNTQCISAKCHGEK